MWHDVKRVTTLREKAGVLFHGPGWTPASVDPAQMESNTRG